MIMVKIGGVERDYSEIDPSWINKRINGMRKDGLDVCVQVRIDQSPLLMHLSTPNCQLSGGSRQPNYEEQKVLELWYKYKLNTVEFSGGNLIAFLKQLASMIN